jgi:hypothetical protein
MKKVLYEDLNRFLDSRLDEVTLDLGANISITSGVTTVESEKRLDIELGGLENLDLANVDVLQGEDALASLLNTVTNDILGNGRRRGDELGNKFLKIARGGLLGHDLKHLLADLADLGRLSIGGLLDLVAATSSEGNDEKTDEVTVGGLDINESLQERLNNRNKISVYNFTKGKHFQIWCKHFTCHFLTRERSLSEVKSIPWKLVRQFLPWISSTLNLTLRKARSSSLVRSPRETSTTRPLR